jgi:hypothetical protein
MQKNQFITVLTFLLIVSLHYLSLAQFDRLNFGIRGGLNLANTNTDVVEQSIELGETYQQKTLPRFSAGGLIEYTLSEKYSVQLNLLYNQKGEKFIATVVEDFVGLVDIEVLNTFDYLSVPVFFKMKFFNSEAKPYLIAGPEFSYLLSANQKIDADVMVIDLDTALVDQSIKDEVQTIEWAVNFGLGLEFPISKYHGFIEGRYGLGLTPFNKEGEEDNNNKIIYLNLGLIF